MDAYGATNEAEFFAVATEQFFDQPLVMIRHAPELYRVLKEYYCQDPAARVGKNYCNIGI
jgi:Mlc titration factor MtfA (ptsG expression regulator)